MMMMLAGPKLAHLQKDQLFDHSNYIRASEKANAAVTQNPPGYKTIPLSNKYCFMFCSAVGFS